MGNAPRVIAALVVAFLVAVGAAFLFMRSDGGPATDPQTKAAEESARSQAREIADLKSRLEQAESEKSTLEADLTQASAKAEDFEKKVESLETAAATPSEAALDEPAPAAAEDEEEDYDTFAQSIRENGMAKTQVKALSQLAFGDFFTEAGLDPETVRQVQELIEASLLEHTALGQYAMKLGNMTAREAKAWSDREDAALASELSQLLTPEQIKNWEEYNANFEERMFEGSFDSQLNSFARGLSPEAHDLALRSTVDHFVAETDAFENSDQPYTLAAQLDLQRRAMNSAREQLRADLTPEEYNLVDNWLRLGETQLDAVQDSANNDQ
ncbi:MAG: hypothetical protein AAB353_05515 [Candidatus Hydrogenedentota bacterium]